MKTYTYIIIGIFCSLFSFSSLQGETFKTSEQVVIYPEKKYQALEGWGSSLCWWAGQVGNWEEKKMDSIIDIITSPDKLNMNIFRYNIGGGDDPSHIDGHMVQGKGKRAEMEGFKASENAPYNWNADKAQRTIMLKIKERRPDAVFEAFSNSPPYWMTFSGCSGGNKNPNEDNLKPEYYDMFCDYLIDVCKHYKEQYGIEFKTLEPFNESYSDYWYDKGTQEGCHFDIESQIKLLRVLSLKLKASGLNTVISASDETNLSHFIKVLTAYNETSDVLGLLGQLNTHTYSGTNAEREMVRAMTNYIGLPFWQSETGPSEGKGFQSNLMLAQKLLDDMRIMHPQAWLDWQLVEENNDVWCLFQADFGKQTYHPVKNLYVRMQITRFFKQGYRFIETNHRNVLGAISPDGKELVLAVLNTTTEQRSIVIDLSRCSKMKIKEMYRTSDTENCLPLAESFPIRRNELRYHSPKQSITTFILKAQ